jgi:S1-C subfamily serine protease
MEFAKATDTKIGQFAIAVGYTLAEFPNTVTF